MKDSRVSLAWRMVSGFPFLACLLAFWASAAGPSLSQGAEEEERLGDDVVTRTSWWDVDAKDRAPVLPAGDEGAHVVILRDSLQLDDGGFVRSEPGLAPKTARNSRPERYSRLFRHRRLLVRDKAGVEAVGNIWMPQEDHEELIGVRARVVKPDGSQRVLSEEDFHERTALASKEVDWKVLVMVVPDLAPGDLVEYMYETRSEFAFVPPVLKLQEQFPILWSTVLWRIREQVPPIPNFDMSRYLYLPWRLVLHSGDHEILSYFSPPQNPDRMVLYTSNIPGIPEEPDQPAEFDTVPYLIMWYEFPAAEETEPYWSRVAGLGLKDREGFINDAKGLDRWMEPVAQASGNPQADADACLKLLHQRFHQTGEERAEGRDRSTENSSIREILQKGAGSSSDMNRLLVAMLRRLGYEARTAACGVQFRGRIIEKWHSMKQLDTEVVAVKDGAGYRFLFPGLRGSTPLSLPYQLAGGRALLTRQDLEGEPEPAAFALFPTFSTRDNVVTSRGRLDLSGDLPIATLEVTWNCPAEAILRDRLAREREDDAKRMLRDMILPDWSAEQVRGERISLLGPTFTYSCSLGTSRLVERAEGILVGDPLPFILERRSYGDDDRRSPVDLLYPRTIRCQLEVIPPAGMQVQPFEAWQERRTGPVRFTVRTNDAGSRIERSAELLIQQSMFQPSDFPFLRSVFREYLEAASRKIAFAAAEVRP